MATTGRTRLGLGLTSTVSFSAKVKNGKLHCLLQQARRPPAHVAATSTQSPTCVQPDTTPESVVETLLSLVEGTDSGALLRDWERAKVEQIVANLEQYCVPEPLQSPLIFGDWDVVYCSNPTAAGGYYRSAIGRVLFKTKQMTQIISFPDIVENNVAFSALGLLNGDVSLKGKLKAMDTHWIEITFDSPDLKIGPLEFQYGGTSSVKIAVIYVDEKIRLGRGSRGSIFVFKRRQSMK